MPLTLPPGCRWVKVPPGGPHLSAADRAGIAELRDRLLTETATRRLRELGIEGNEFAIAREVARLRQVLKKYA